MGGQAGAVWNSGPAGRFGDLPRFAGWSIRSDCSLRGQLFRMTS